MCRVYNQIGCLTTIKSHLLAHNINEFSSTNELINFQKSYLSLRQRIISDHEIVIEHEKATLIEGVELLALAIHKSKVAAEQPWLSILESLNHQLFDLSSVNADLISKFNNGIKKIFLKIKRWFYKIIYYFKVDYPIRHLANDHDSKRKRLQFITWHFQDAIMESCSPHLREIDRKKAVIDQINSFIYGAQGEQKVVNVLEKLSDDCILINDFSCQFSRAIYHREENDYIKSVQMDHVLLTPAGIFLIETKNWNQKSLNDQSLFSPIKQIRRANIALYRILHGELSWVKLIILKHKWGGRKIPIRNLIVFTNERSSEEFQYVKILTLSNLLSYVKYFEPCLSTDETQTIANFLLARCGKVI